MSCAGVRCSMDISRYQGASLLPPWRLCTAISFRTRSSKATLPKFNVLHVLKINSNCKTIKFVLRQLCRSCPVWMWRLFPKSEYYLAPPLEPGLTLNFCIEVQDWTGGLQIIRGSDVHNSMLYLSENVINRFHLDCKIWNYEAANSARMNNELCCASLHIASLVFRGVS